MAEAWRRLRRNPVAVACGVYILALEGLPKGAKLSGTPLRLTLSTGNGGIETVYTLP